VKSLTLTVAAVVLLTGSQAWASHAVVTLNAQGSRFAGNVQGGCTARGCGNGGLLKRLCGQRNNYAYAAGSTTQVMTQDLSNVCPPLGSTGTPGSKHQALKNLAWLLDLNKQHCYPDCYTGTPCTCCNHNPRHITPGTAEHYLYAFLIKTHLRRSFKVN
jgi:hypothetical protein